MIPNNFCKNNLDPIQPPLSYVALYLHIGMQLEVTRLITYSKVVLGHLWLGGVKGHLVARKPSFITDHCSTMDSWTSKVKVDITAQVDKLAFVGSLDFSALLAVESQSFILDNVLPKKKTE